MECISVFDMLKIGVGPSSSHTLGPWRAAERWIKELKDANSFDKVESIKVDLFGSLSLTGKGHATDYAVMLGLTGADPETMPTENIDATIIAKEELVKKLEIQLAKISSEITKKRSAILPKLKTQLEQNLATLGMPNATFKIELSPALDFTASGKDILTFLFSANKGSDYGELKKVASGGELSRIMLTTKSILAKYEQLPTLMFDEIDSGVSGEISNKMGSIMQEMSSTMQIFSITPFPQVASKGSHHFKVFKEDIGNVTHTKMRKLSDDERVVELAEMLGGKELSDSAIAHAKQLLN